MNNGPGNHGSFPSIPPTPPILARLAEAEAACGEAHNRISALEVRITALEDAVGILRPLNEPSPMMAMAAAKGIR